MTPGPPEPANAQTAIERLAALIAEAPVHHARENLTRARDTLVDTVSCMLAGARQPVALQAFDVVSAWSGGDAVVVGRPDRLSPPFAAMVNAAAGHAFDFDDYDQAANAHPSVILWSALLAMASEHEQPPHRFLDAYIVGLEILQRLGEAVGFEHYRRGWVTTMTVGTLAVAGACSRLTGHDRAAAGAALSVAVSMAAGLTVQFGHTAKQLHPGLTAKNGILAAAFAGSGITASPHALDGASGLIPVMGAYIPARLDAALAKLAAPWSIEEHGVIAKPYPTCGYGHRLIDIAIDIHRALDGDTRNIQSITVSVPDYYAEVMVYPRPTTAAEAMFSTEYNAAAGIARGGFDLSCLNDTALADPEIERLRQATSVVARTPPNPLLPYDPEDPDWIEVRLSDGRIVRRQCAVPLGNPGRPLSETDQRRKFDQCAADHGIPADRDRLWGILQGFEGLPTPAPLLEELAGPAS